MNTIYNNPPKIRKNGIRLTAYMKVGHIVILISAGICVFFCFSYLPMEQVFVEYWHKRWSESKTLDEIKCRSNVEVYQFSDGSWIVGVCYDSHNPFWRCFMKAGLFILHDSQGRTRGFSRHVCGSCSLSGFVHILDHVARSEEISLEYAYGMLVKSLDEAIEPQYILLDE